MEVDRGSFWPELLSILHAISSSTFVAVDVEMSGITTKQRYGPNSRQTDANKLTLQEQYEETKSAAERYQVLQVGLTCIEENPDEGMS
jgi:poly(A)-specific ribonuclease